MTKMQFTIEGRIARKDYIIAQLLPVAILFFLAILHAVLRAVSDLYVRTQPIMLLFLAIFIIIYTVFIYTMAIRRLHDLGMSGWYALVLLVPFVGFIFGLYLLVAPGQAIPNEYGNIPE